MISITRDFLFFVISISGGFLFSVISISGDFLFFVISISLETYCTSELADAVVMQEAGRNGDVERGAALHLPDEVVARLPHSRRQADVLCTPGGRGGPYQAQAYILDTRHI